MVRKKIILLVNQDVGVDRHLTKNLQVVILFSRK